MLLTPAVVPDGTFGLVSFRGIAGGNNFLTDGNDTTDQFYNENAGRTRIASQISQDAVQEFQVISDNYSAEYGRASGGIVNTLTRSGTNDIHGTAFWFFRDQDFNARDRYANFNPPEHRDQVGGVVGGAIVKNKLFYFLDYEKTLRNFPLIASLTSAPLFNPAGQFQTTQPNGSATCGAPATPAQCATAISFLTTRNFGTVPRTVNQDLGFAKIDFRPTEKHTFSFSGNYLDWISPNGIQTQAVLNNGNGIGNNADSTVRTRYGRADWTYVITPTIIMESRFGYFKDRLYDAASPDFISPQLGLAGLTILGDSNLGYATSYPRLNPSEQRFEGANNVSISAGAHTIKFGLDIAHTEDYQDQLATQYGSYSYSSFTNYALDFSGNTTGAKNYSSYTQAFGNPIVDTNLTDYGLYFQDQWRISSHFLVNLGVRYDYADIQQPSLYNHDYPQTGSIHTPTGDFAPRVGLAYSLNNGKTVLRGGYGLFYARFQTGLINTLFLSNNLYQETITLTAPADIAALGPVYPNYLPSTTRTPPPGTTDITFADKNLRNPYTAQWNGAVDQQITPTLGLTINYIGSTGIDLYSVRDLNVGALSSQTATYQILNSSKAVIGTYTTPVYLLANRVDPRYRRINQVENGGKSYYDGLAVQLNKRYSNGFQAGVAYTWSHAIDFGQGGASNNIFFSSGAYQLLQRRLPLGKRNVGARHPASRGDQFRLAAGVFAHVQPRGPLTYQRMGGFADHHVAVVSPRAGDGERQRLRFRGRRFPGLAQWIGLGDPRSVRPHRRRACRRRFPRGCTRVQADSVGRTREPVPHVRRVQHLQYSLRHGCQHDAIHPEHQSRDAVAHLELWLWERLAGVSGRHQRTAGADRAAAYLLERMPGARPLGRRACC